MLSAIMMLNTVRLAIEGYFPIIPLQDRKVRVIEFGGFPSSIVATKRAAKTNWCIFHLPCVRIDSPRWRVQDKLEGFRNFRTAAFGVAGGCDQNFSDTTGKFVFLRLLYPVGLGPVAALVGAVILATPLALKAHMLGVVGTQAVYCFFGGLLLDASIAVNSVLFVGTVVIQFMCFSACRN